MAEVSSQSQEKPKRISMRTIARKAKVSTTAVSLALRDHSSISPKTKERILKIQRSLGYQFKGNRQDSGRSRRPSLEQIVYQTVGVDMREDNYAPFLTGIMAECRQLGVRLELDNVPGAEFVQLNAVRSAVASKRGVIISGRVTDKDIEVLERAGLPFIVLGNCRLTKPVHLVGVDLLESAERAMRDLITAGMKETILFVETRERNFEHEFLRDLIAVLQDLGISQEQISIIEAGQEFHRIDDAAKEVLGFLKPGTHVVCLEQRCADILSQSLRLASTDSLIGTCVASFVTNSFRLSLPSYRAFDVGAELCGRLAVVRLDEIQRHSNLPINSCLVRSPGWMD